ncbi:unnamed protein product [[Candida] boidinii]|uniref:Unnamed protein product n=1 Tax=Candida boidinii TaxID=5477 RepID=A0A9W6T5U5_CANBO|nr:unnamed protein product [[Candida] boidinii]
MRNWTREEELILLNAICYHKPVGLEKQNDIPKLIEKVNFDFAKNKFGSITEKEIMDKLSIYYDLEGLNRLDFEDQEAENGEEQEDEDEDEEEEEEKVEIKYDESEVDETDEGEEKGKEEEEDKEGEESEDEKSKDNKTANKRGKHKIESDEETHQDEPVVKRGRGRRPKNKAVPPITTEDDENKGNEESQDEDQDQDNRRSETVQKRMLKKKKSKRRKEEGKVTMLIKTKTKWRKTRKMRARKKK